MRKTKWWKRVVAMMLGIVLVVPAQAVSAEETKAAEQTVGESGENEEEKREGFQIEDGILQKYTGTATEVVIPEGVVSIGYGAFSKCLGVKSITVPVSVESGLEYAIADNDGLEAINVLQGNKHYASFDNCLYDNNFTSILGCPRAKEEVKILGSITRIADRAFWGCSNLRNIILPEGVEYIGSGAFYNCCGLIRIRIPEGVKEVGYEIFNGCRNLLKVRVPQSIGLGLFDATFWGCGKLEHIKVEDGVSNIRLGGLMSGSNQLIRLTVPESVTSIIDDHCGTASPGLLGNLVIYGKEGSYAQSFAKEKNITFIAGEDPAFAQKELSSCRISVESLDFVYDGTAKKPEVTVWDGNNILLEGLDYLVAYRNNTEPGEAEITITGVEDYMGEVTKKFTIHKAVGNIRCKKSYNKVYGDKAFSLNIKVNGENRKITYKSSDEKVVVVDENGNVKMKGIGIATITAEVEKSGGYQAETAKITIKVSPARQTIKALKTQKGGKITVKWKRDKNSTGYQIQYSTHKKFKRNAKMISVGKNKTISKTITKLAKGKTYYIRVRAYKSIKVNGRKQKLCGTWSSAARIKTIKK